MNVGYRVPVRCGGVVKRTVVTARSSIARCFLGHHVEREKTRHWRRVGRYLTGTCVQTLFATLRLSGASCLGRAETGGPVVSMWCCTSYFTGVSGAATCVSAENSDKSCK